MAIISSLSSRLIESINEITVVANYLKDVGKIVERINRQEGPIVRYDLGAGIYALEQIFNTRDHKECFYESHKRFVDVQILLEGKELMQLFNVYSDKVDLLSYDMETDFCIYSVDPEIVSSLSMMPGDVYVFFPEDGHLGMMKNVVQSLVKKTVLKIPIEYFEESSSFWR